MKTLLNLFTICVITNAINAQNKPGYFTDKGAKTITESTRAELKKSNDIAVRIPIDSVFYKYDDIYIQLTVSTNDPKSSAQNAYFEVYKKDYRKFFKDKKDILLFILNPDKKVVTEGGGLSGLVGSKDVNYTGDFLGMDSNRFWLSCGFNLKGSKECKTPQLLSLKVKGYMITGTKQQWNANNQSWSTVNLYDESGSDILSETQMTIN